MSRMTEPQMKMKDCMDMHNLATDLAFQLWRGSIGGGGGVDGGEMEALRRLCWVRAGPSTTMTGPWVWGPPAGSPSAIITVTTQK